MRNACTSARKGYMPPSDSASARQQHGRGAHGSEAARYYRRVEARWCKSSSQCVLTKQVEYRYCESVVSTCQFAQRAPFSMPDVSDVLRAVDMAAAASQPLHAKARAARARCYKRRENQRATLQRVTAMF